MALSNTINSATGAIKSTIKKVSDLVNKGLAFVRDKAKIDSFIPAVMLLCEIERKPGLSAIALTSAVISRLSELGVVTQVNEDGTPNKVTGIIRVCMEEIVKEFKTNAYTEVVLKPLSVFTEGTGANAGGPLTMISHNIDYIRGKGDVN